MNPALWPPALDWESTIAAPDAAGMQAFATGHYAAPGHYDRKRYRERAMLNDVIDEAQHEIPAEPGPRTLADIVEEGLVETRAKEAAELERRERSQAQARAAQERIDRMEAAALEGRMREWAKRGRAGLVADLTAVGWRVDATDLNRLVLRRGEGMLALSLPFSPKDACELEDRHGWAFLPWL